MLEAGEPHQLMVIAPGHQRRIQAGILSWGQDVDHETVPFQCNLAYQVPRKKRGDYIGRAALERMRAEIEAGRPPFMVRRWREALSTSGWCSSTSPPGPGLAERASGTAGGCEASGFLTAGHAALARSPFHVLQHIPTRTRASRRLAWFSGGGGWTIIVRRVFWK